MIGHLGIVRAAGRLTTTGPAGTFDTLDNLDPGNGMKQGQVTADYIRERESVVHASWPSRNESYWSDGAVHAETFVKEALRIVFVLKEANAQSKTAAGVRALHGQDLRDFLRAGGRSPTWDGVACWAHALLNQATGSLELPWSEYGAKLKVMKDSPARRAEHLRRIAVMNLSKGDGKTVSNTDFVSMSKDKVVLDALRGQHAVYDAHVTVCCGAHVSLVMGRALEVEWSPTSRGVGYSRLLYGGVALAFAHPEARLGGQFLLYALIDAIAEISGSKGGTT